MARNEEKHYSRLNRLLLQEQHEENLRRNPKRPRLDNLHSVEEIKQWIPNIKKEIDFNLKQSQVTCYSEHKISEFQNNIGKLENEFKAFIRKIKRLEPELNHVPWISRPYQSTKVKAAPEANNENNETLVKIQTPVLDGLSSSSSEKSVPNLTNVDLNQLDKPLVFSSPKISGKCKKPRQIINETNNNRKCTEVVKTNHFSDNQHGSDSNIRIFKIGDGNILGLDYSSSDSES